MFFSVICMRARVQLRILPETSVSSASTAECWRNGIFYWSLSALIFHCMAALLIFKQSVKWQWLEQERVSRTFAYRKLEILQCAFPHALTMREPKYCYIGRRRKLKNGLCWQEFSSTLAHKNVSHKRTIHIKQDLHLVKCCIFEQGHHRVKHLNKWLLIFFVQTESPGEQLFDE